VQVRVRATAEDVARSVAREVARLVALKPAAVLGLPTGRTPIPLYRQLVRLHRRSGPQHLDLARASAFNVDEFVGLGSNDPGSYHAFMRAHLFDRVEMPRRHTHIPTVAPATSTANVSATNGPSRAPAGSTC
jgi:glucosamine-6-phosphate deaminase